MATAAQKRANKQNAQHSTGPRTDEGKQRSSLNALKHGFRAKGPLIPGEDRDEFDRHSVDLETELRPVSYLELNLVEQIIDITWRIKRFARIEAVVINELYDSAAEHPRNHDKDGDQLLSKALAQSNVLNRLSRYEAQLARRYQNTMKELRELPKRRRASAFLSSLAAGSKAQAVEPTQSIASPLESTSQINVSTSTPDREHNPSRIDVAQFHRTNPQDPARTGNQEAAT